MFIFKKPKNKIMLKDKIKDLDYTPIINRLCDANRAVRSIAWYSMRQEVDIEEIERLAILSENKITI